MNSEHQEASQAGLSAAALGEWSGHVESVLRGIGHALNNRAAALSAVLELARDPDEDPSVYASILSQELQRVNELVATVRAIGVMKPAMEAFAAADAVADAALALANHPMGRERRVVFDAASAPALRVQRGLYVRALIALGANAMLASTDTTICISGDGDWVVTRARLAAGSRTMSGAYVADVARAMGGEPLGDGTGFRVPSLEAVRRREGREG